MFFKVNIKLVAALAILSISFSSLPPASICQTKIDGLAIGTWQGTLEFSGNKIRIVFHVAKTDSGTMAVSLDSPDQGIKGIPAAVALVDRDSVRFSVESIGGDYVGRVSANDSSIDGKWMQGGFNLPLTMIRTNVEITYNRPQEPKPPFPYESEDVVFESNVTGMKYAGTLTYPDSGGPFPAAILITGSGAHDRNEELFGHKPFLVIADYLTRRGIAILRVDDRGIGGSTGNKMEATSPDHARDVTAEIKFLKSHKEINPHKIGLIGHSEGGIIAPMVAAKSDDVAFIVLLAGPGIPGYQVILDQITLLNKSAGADDSSINAALSVEKRVLDIVMTEKNSVKAAVRLTAILETEGGETVASADASIDQLLSPSYRSLLQYDPHQTLDKLKCPVLAMDGTLDLQVPGEENLKAIGDALKEGGNKDYTIKLLPGLNHLFQDAKTGSPTEYAQIEETISPKALKVIGDWIEERVSQK
ncbi:MAG: alpha/beta hydrolase family protein [Candidatus Kryptoniota bacterium]